MARQATMIWPCSAVMYWENAFVRFERSLCRLVADQASARYVSKSTMLSPGALIVEKCVILFASQT